MFDDLLVASRNAWKSMISDSVARDQIPPFAAADHIFAIVRQFHAECLGRDTSIVQIARHRAVANRAWP